MWLWPHAQNFIQIIPLSSPDFDNLPSFDMQEHHQTRARHRTCIRFHSARVPSAFKLPLWETNLSNHRYPFGAQECPSENYYCTQPAPLRFSLALTESHSLHFNHPLLGLNSFGPHFWCCLREHIKGATVCEQSWYYKCSALLVIHLINHILEFILYMSRLGPKHYYTANAAPSSVAVIHSHWLKSTQI